MLTWTRECTRVSHIVCTYKYITSYVLDFIVGSTGGPRRLRNIVKCLTRKHVINQSLKLRGILHGDSASRRTNECEEQEPLPRRRPSLVLTRISEKLRGLNCPCWVLIILFAQVCIYIYIYTHTRTHTHTSIH